MYISNTHTKRPARHRIDPCVIFASSDITLRAKMASITSHEEPRAANEMYCYYGYIQIFRTMHELRSSSNHISLMVCHINTHVVSMITMSIFLCVRACVRVCVYAGVCVACACTVVSVRVCMSTLR